MSGPAEPRAGGVGHTPWVWGELIVEKESVTARLSGWRRVLSTKAAITVPLASVARVEHDPMARAHVRSGLRNWRRHGQGIWRLGVYHGIDGWSFWSIGIGRNAVLIECSGERFRYLVIEVADPQRAVREIRSAAGRLTGRIPGGAPAPPAPGEAPTTEE